MQDIAKHLADTMKKMNRDFPHFGSAHMKSSQDWWGEVVYNTFKGTSFHTAAGSSLESFTVIYVFLPGS